MIKLSLILAIVWTAYYITVIEVYAEVNKRLTYDYNNLKLHKLVK